jgi:hypothetical protein
MTGWTDASLPARRFTIDVQGVSFAMPTYMDIHNLPGVTAADAAGAHAADLRVQGDYGVDYRAYWVDEAEGKVFCLVDAPDRETANRVHREAHGLEAHVLHEVEQGA